MIAANTLTINGKEVPIGDAPNLLELIRRQGIEIPTFCYHSELSVYGACRLCVVEIEGRGVQTSCSTAPQPGMVVRTHTQELRDMRKVTLELLLASHDQSCTTCGKSNTCKLLDLTRKLGVDEVRFKEGYKDKPLDTSAPSLVRNTNKCVLCGDCVRFCHEIQGIGAIDFAGRGANVTVEPAFGKDLNQVECVHCGQCARVCPTGALTPAPQMDGVWNALNDADKTVVVQIAPAVRVALGEQFGLEPGTITTGQIVAAMKQMGFAQVYDTSFAADLTVLEEANEFLGRKAKGEKLPQFTSCCPAWVKYAEQYCPDMLDNLSTCRSPQQMFGSLAKRMLPDMLDVKREDLVVVSIMPCTAKKFEAQRDEFTTDDVADVDFVLTTQELGTMIEAAGLAFDQLEPESLDLPMGFKTGAGVIFGATGGVTEAVLRYGYEKVTGKKLVNFDFHQVRGMDGLREATIDLDGVPLKLAMVHGLANAGKVAEAIRKGECDYDLIEVMACPGGCIGGAGQPVTYDPAIRQRRAGALYKIDKGLQLHKSQDNYTVTECYNNLLGEPNSHTAHELLHTEYQSRRRLFEDSMSVHKADGEVVIPVRVCLGTGCHLRGSQHLLKEIMDYVQKNELQEHVDINATFCMENCEKGPSVTIGETCISKCTTEKAVESLMSQLFEANKSG